MINLQRLSELIDHVSILKSCFSAKSVVMATSYSFEERKRKSHSMQLKTIYKHPDFIKWKADLEYELSKLKQDQLVLDILKLFNRFTGWADENVFAQLEAKLLVSQGHLSEYEKSSEQTLNIDDVRIPEREFREKLIGTLCKLQKNAHYCVGDSEDTMNDYIRDMLSGSYEVKDQTRQGESTNGGGAGEVDIQVCYSGLPVVMSKRQTIRLEI